MSGFSTLNTAVSGLTASQRALEAAGQNIVNANTPGYSRQRVLLASVGSPTTATFFTGNRSQLAGVTVQDITRMRDAFLEATRAAAGGRQASLTAQAASLTGAQQLLAEPGETGLQASLDKFYSSWHDLANNAGTSGQGAAGSVVIQSAVAVTDQLHAVTDGVTRQWSTSWSNLADVVSRANQAASDLANVNARIREGSGASRNVNELLDQRDTLVRSLSDLVGGTAIASAGGDVTVSVNGIAIVSGDRAEKFTLSGATDLSNAATDPPTLSWGSTPVPLDSGSAAGFLAVLRTDLPNLSASIDAVATTLRDAVNTVHANGFVADGSAGGTFFDGTDARTLEVTVTDGSQLAIASAAGTVDGSIAMQIGDLSSDAASAALLGQPGPSAKWRNLTTGLGVQVQSLNTANKVQDAVVAAADSAVDADSGVNLDEEMTNMLLYQRSYQASARVISTVDEMLDTLINRTLR